MRRVVTPPLDNRRDPLQLHTNRRGRSDTSMLLVIYRRGVCLARNVSLQLAFARTGASSPEHAIAYPRISTPTGHVEQPATLRPVGGGGQTYVR